MLKHVKLLYTVFLIFLIGNMVYSQNPALTSLEQKIQEGQFKEALTLLQNINLNSLTASDKAHYYYLKAKYHESRNDDDKAYDAFIEAKKLYKQVQDTDKAMDINLDIVYVLKAKQYKPRDYERYVLEYYNHALKSEDPLKIARGYGYMAMLEADKEQNSKALMYYLKGLANLNSTDRDDIKSAFYNNVANLYNEKLNKPDSGLYYLKKDLAIVKQSGSIEDFYHNYLNQAAAYHHKKDYNTSNVYLKKADSLPMTHYALGAKQLIYENFTKNYEMLGDYQQAYKYSVLSNEVRSKLDNEEQKKQISGLEIKYKTKEKEVENLQLKDRVTNKNNLLYALGALLLISIIVGWLTLKNSHKRQKIALQEKLIEQQKFEKALKDYELNSIDMMLEGQEKERQRIANDLHDNLGSMLATLKLNFENLKLRKNELKDEETRLYERTDELIEEAYQKVRRLAHAKNAGVLANDGLIPAVKKLADKISIPNKLSIQVIPFGFDERIENTLEIAIFRMVQELATNIIKHAEATEATIHLTHHENNINIIVEDNGKGFNNSSIEEADGMGVASIRKKTTQLGGTMTIDSTPGKGTTIIIDIPV